VTRARDPRAHGAASAASNQSLGRLALDLQVLVAAVGTLVALLVVAILIAIFLIIRVGDDATDLGEDPVQYSSAINEAAVHAKGIANDERGYLLSGEEQFLAEMEMRSVLAREAFADAAKAADDAQYPAVSEAYDGFERWLLAVKDDIAAFQAGDREAATESSLGATRELRKMYEAAIARAQSLADDAIESAASSVSTSSISSIAILVTYLVVAVAIGVAITIWIVRVIVRPAQSLMQSVGERDRLDTPA
jgi:methyl-accepting chemotaxis protein